MARFDFDDFSRDTQTVAQLVPSSSIFTFLNRRIRMPVSCMGLAWGAGDQPSIVHPGADLESDGLTRIMVVRAEPCLIDYQFPALPSADAHDISAHLRFAVQLVPERSELASFFARVLAGAERISHSHLLRHCEEPVRLCAAAFCKARSAEDLLSVDMWSQFDADLAAAFKSFGFESGLSLGPDVRAEFRSPAYAEIVRLRKVEQTRKQRLDADAAFRAASNEAREKHLNSLAGLMEKVRTMTSSGAGVSVPDLLKTFDSAQRGELYGGLLNNAKEKITSVLLVAGDEIIAVEPATRKIASRRALEPQFGPLRSIRIAEKTSERRILVGARSVVNVLDSDLNRIDSFSFEPPRALRGGINACAIRERDLFATHSEVGLISWKMQGPKAHSMCLTDLTAGAKAIREIQADDSALLWFSADRRVIAVPPGVESSPVVLEADAEVSALLVADGYAYAGLVTGAILRWPCKPPHDKEIIRGKTGDTVESLDWLAGGGVPRLLVADNRPMIELRVIGDTYVAEYHAPQPLRWAWAAGPSIIAINDRRDQLLFWELDKPSAPSAVVHVAKLCGHTIQDAAVL